jgi:hypothetical protein
MSKSRKHKKEFDQADMRSFKATIDANDLADVAYYLGLYKVIDNDKGRKNDDVWAKDMLKRAELIEELVIQKMTDASVPEPIQKLVVDLGWSHLAYLVNGKAWFKDACEQSLKKGEEDSKALPRHVADIVKYNALAKLLEKEAPNLTPMLTSFSQNILEYTQQTYKKNIASTVKRLTDAAVKEQKARYESKPADHVQKVCAHYCLEIADAVDTYLEELEQLYNKNKDKSLLKKMNHLYSVFGTIKENDSGLAPQAQLKAYQKAFEDNRSLISTKKDTCSAKFINKMVAIFKRVFKSLQPVQEKPGVGLNKQAFTLFTKARESGGFAALPEKVSKKSSKKHSKK